ncbi:hypothetical protein BH18GEM1_BH18GEM1_22780 [soil metagenome]
MIRTQVQLTKDQLEALRALSAREKISLSELVRRAVDAWVRAEPAPSEQERKDRALRAAGRFSSGAHDVASRHDEYLSDAFRT